MLPQVGARALRRCLAAVAATPAAPRRCVPAAVQTLVRSFALAPALAPDPDMAKYYQAAHTKQTAVSLQALHVFGKLASGPDAVKTFITAACFLHRELPIRFAHRIVELDHLPHGLAEMSAIRKVSSWYKQSFREIAEHPLPDTPEKEASFARLLEAIYERHGPTLVTMAKGIYQFRRSLGIPHGQPLPYSIEENVQRYLDTFFSSRVGIRTLISHYVTLHRPAPPFIGIINTECCPAQVIRDAVTDARAVCERVYGDAPDVEILGATDFKFSFVPAYLHHIAFELIKNSMRAVVESHNRRAAEEEAARVAALSNGSSGGNGRGEASGIFESSGTPPGLVHYPPIRAILSASEGCEDVTIKISDEGGGIPRSSMARTFNYFFSTAPPQFSEDDEGDTAQDFTRSVPLAGLGVGLSLSRVMARYFAGDLQLVSMEGWGTDAFIFLRRLGDAAEPIREASFGGEAIVSFPGFQPERASSSSLTGSVFSPHAGASSGPAAESGSTGSGPSWPFAGGAPSGGASGSGAAAFFPAAGGVGAAAGAGAGGVASVGAAGLQQQQRPATAHASVRLKIRKIGEAAHAAVAAAQAQASLTHGGATGGAGSSNGGSSSAGGISGAGRR